MNPRKMKKKTKKKKTLHYDEVLEDLSCFYILKTRLFKYIEKFT